MKRVYTTYWLVCCVFLFFHQPADMALAFSGAGQTIGKDSDAASPLHSRIVIAHNMPSIITYMFDFQDPSSSQCADYEMFNGAECVCASNSTAQCTRDGGMVCDDQGGHYKSKCDFALQTCQQIISLNRTITSCGACAMLRLTGGKGNPLDATLANFRRKGKSNGFSTTYESTVDSSVEIFHVREAGSWAIGRRNSSGSFISMIQVLNGSYPEEANPGMLIPQKNGSWVVDHSYQLECVSEPETGHAHHRHKRFIFLLIFGITAAVTATTTTLKVVQATNGCLYFPEVCRMRDEIKGHLLPNLKRDKRTFLHKFGDPVKFKSTAEKVLHQLLDIKEKIITIPDLRTQLNISVSSMVGLYSFIQNDFPYLKTILSDYKDWLSAVSQSAAQAVAMLPIDIMTTLPALIAVSVGSLALVAAGIGAVAGFVFAIVDLVASINEERRVRDQLKAQRNKLISARRKLDYANKKMEQFQSQFCLHIVPFMYELSKRGMAYDVKFRSLYNFIVNTYRTSTKWCSQHTIVSRTNYGRLHGLAYHFLAPLLSMLSHDVIALKRRIHDVKETNAFIDVIKQKIGINMKPADVFQFIKSNKPVLTKNMFNNSNYYSNLYAFLKFISKTVLPKKSCYWGYDLEKIRRGIITDQNYILSPICDCHEIAAQVGLIKTGVQKQYILCKIYRQLDKMVFRTKYHVIKFIADNILQHDACYWGYDLNDIRGAQYVSGVNTAKIDSGLVGTLRNLETGSPLSLTRRIMHYKYGINTDKWQTFILCHVWHNPNSKKQLGCAVNNNDTCNFDDKIYQSC